MTRIPPYVDAAILDRIDARTGRRVQNLRIEVWPTEVVVRGEVQSFHVKQLATAGVRDVLPTAALTNALVVNG